MSRRRVDPYAGHTWTPPVQPAVDLDEVIEELAALEDGECSAHLHEGCDCEHCTDVAVMEGLFPPPRPEVEARPSPRYL